MEFITLDYICMLEELYDKYCEECEDKGVAPLNQKKWYKEIYGNIE